MSKSILIKPLLEIAVTAALVWAYVRLTEATDPTLPWILFAPVIVSIFHFALFHGLAAPHLLTAPLLFASRAARLRYVMHRAILWWQLERGGSDRTNTLRQLNAAIRLSQGLPERTLCQTFADHINGGDRAAADAACAELRAVLPARDLRAPRIGQWTPIKRLVITAALLLTLPVALVLSLSQGLGGPLRLQDIPVVLAALWLFRALGLFAYEVWFARKTAHSLTGFSTLIVTEAEASAELRVYAQDLYWRVGKVIVVYVMAPEEDGVGGWVADGTEHIVVPRDLLGDSLAILTADIDLAVAFTEDLDLAQEVLDQIDLPRDRRLALNGQSRARNGYAWIEQAAMAVDPAQRDLFCEARPPLTRYDRRMPSEGAGFGVNAPLLCSIAVLWVPGGIGASLVFAALGIALLLMRIMAMDRRFRVSRDTLRRPADTARSAKLDPKRLKILLNVAAAVAGLPCIAIVALSLPSLTGALPWLLVGLIVLAGAFTPFFVLIGMRFAKWRLDRDFRILVFRRNSGKYGYALISHVMGLAGKYGQVLLLDHPTVQSYKTGPRNDHQGNNSHWSYYFAEPDLQIGMSDLRPDWQRTCLTELEFADFAIFDWSEEVTDAMAWELRMAALALPPERLLVVLNTDVSADAALATLDPEIGARVPCVVLPRGPDDRYIWSNHRPFAKAFDAVLAAQLATLDAGPRKTGIVAVRGVWPFPVPQTENS